MRNVTALIFLILAAHTAPVFGQAASCNYNSSNEIITDSSGFVDCVADNGEQRISIQYMAMCQATPSVTDYQTKCEEIFDLPTGKEIILSQGAVLDLLAGSSVSLTEGTYTHAVIRIDSLIKMKGSYLFDKPLLGGAGGVGKRCWTATTGTIGTYSDTQDYLGYSSLNQLATQCGTVATPEFTSQDYNAFTGSAGFTNSITGRSSPSGPYSLYTLKDPNTLSSTNPSSLDGEHLLGIQEFSNPVIISPTLTSIDYGFRMEGMFHLQSNWQSRDSVGDNPSRTSGGGGNKHPEECLKNQSVGNACLVYVIPMGFEFSVTTQ